MNTFLEKKSLKYEKTIGSEDIYIYKRKTYKQVLERWLKYGAFM